MTVDKLKDFHAPAKVCWQLCWRLVIFWYRNFIAVMVHDVNITDALQNWVDIKLSYATSNDWQRSAFFTVNGMTGFIHKFTA